MSTSNQCPSIALIDYGMGNLRSVAKAFELSGARVEWVDRPERIRRHDVVLLPGVGAFQVAVENLKKRKLFDPVRKWIEEKKYFFGICLGYQLLFERSDEGSRDSEGLAVFKGDVEKIPRKKNLRIPHMGWNTIFKKPEAGSQKSDQKKADLYSVASGLFSGIPEKSYFYFVHSYVPVPEDKHIIATTTEYGVQFASSIATDRLFASQFHPEKSGENGLRLIRNFIRLCQ